MDYQPVVVRKYARPASTKHNAESRYWRKFKHPVFIKEYAPVTSVHFSPSKPHRYAVTAATRVQIYAPRTQKVTKTISRFKDVARSGCIRGDGKLVAAGDETGLIQVCTPPGPERRAPTSWTQRHRVSDCASAKPVYPRFSISIRVPFFVRSIRISSRFTS